MPAIITHLKLIIESVAHINRKKDITPFTRTLESFFREPEFLGAACLGAIGPDIYDYLPFMFQRGHLGAPPTSYLHSSGLKASLGYLSDLTLKNNDYANEWSALQRAYFYGYVSHIIADQLFHPFIFYWTGFPRNDSQRSSAYYREQLLLFEYNMDIYFQYYHDRNETSISVSDCLSKTVTSRRSRPLKEPLFRIASDLLQFIYGTPADTKSGISIIPDGLRRKAVLFMLGHITLIIKSVFMLKTSKHSKIGKVLSALQSRKLLATDLSIAYPEPRRLNKHVLNLHRERWFYPAGGSGLHYESVEDLFKIAREKTIQVWEMLDSYLYGHGPRLDSILRELELNCYTGERDKGADLMTVCNEYRLRF
jgi:hypothetical protein